VTDKARNKTPAYHEYFTRGKWLQSKPLTGHHLKEYKPLSRASLNIPEKVKIYFLYW